MEAKSRSSTRIDHDEVVARFNQRFPEIHLKTYHSSFLLELFTRNSDQNSGGQASNKGSALCHSVRHLSQHGTTPAVVAPYPKPDIQTPGRAQANQKRALAPTDNVFEESGMLSHRDFLACAAAAVSRSEKVDSTKKIVCRRILNPVWPFLLTVGGFWSQLGSFSPYSSIVLWE